MGEQQRWISELLGLTEVQYKPSVHTHWQVHQFIQVVIKTVRSSIVSTGNFLYFNDTYSVSKQVIIGVM